MHQVALYIATTVTAIYHFCCYFLLHYPLVQPSVFILLLYNTAIGLIFIDMIYYCYHPTLLPLLSFGIDIYACLLNSYDIVLLWFNTLFFHSHYKNIKLLYSYCGPLLLLFLD